MLLGINQIDLVVHFPDRQEFLVVDMLLGINQIDLVVHFPDRQEF